MERDVAGGDGHASGEDGLVTAGAVERDVGVGDGDVACVGTGLEHQVATTGSEAIDGSLEAISGRDTSPARHLYGIPAEDDEATSSVERVEVFPQAVLAVDDDGFIADG